MAVPSLASVDPEYARLVEKRVELQLRRRELETENVRIIGELESAGSLVRSEQARRVAALIDQPEDKPLPMQDAAKLQKQRELNRSTIADIDLALRTLEDRIGEERGRASAAVVEQVRPYHNALAGRICDALVALAIAVTDYRNFTDRLEAEDVSWLGRLEPMFPRGVGGDPRDRQSNIAMFLRDAAQAGFLDDHELPETIRLSGN